MDDDDFERERRDEYRDDERGGCDSPLGYHKGCGGQVSSRTYPGAHDGPFGPPIEPDETVLTCGKCGAELVDDDEMTDDPDEEEGE